MAPDKYKAYLDYLTILNGSTLLISDSEEEKAGNNTEIKAESSV